MERRGLDQGWSGDGQAVPDIGSSCDAASTRLRYDLVIMRLGYI